MNNIIEHDEDDFLRIQKARNTGEFYTRDRLGSILTHHSMQLISPHGSRVFSCIHPSIFEDIEKGRTKIFGYKICAAGLRLKHLKPYRWKIM